MQIMLNFLQVIFLISKLQLIISLTSFLKKMIFLMITYHRQSKKFDHLFNLQVPVLKKQRLHFLRRLRTSFLA
ncbi:hypothetical protein ASE66_26905 [Bosea sp. Root483D1]|nr:hypothetical protein ASE66_26905 [Bosea sp. Root483D1]